MKKNNQTIKLFFVLLLCTAYIFAFSHFGVLAFEKYYKQPGVFSAGTEIGPVSVGGKNRNETLALINQQYSDWMRNTKITIHYKEKEAAIDLNQFQFNLEDSVSTAKDGLHNPLMAGIGKDHAEGIAALAFPGIDINVNAFTKKLNIVASSLSKGENVINLKEFIKNSDKSSSISESVLTPKTAPDEVERAVGQLAKIQVHANSTFSFNELLKKERLNNLSGKALSFIASGIYKAILPTNFSIIERNIGRELPEYAELGYEAKIDPAQNDDFVFSNPNESDFNIEISWDGKQLKTSLLGQKLYYEYQITETDKQQFKPKTILQYSPLLADNQKEVLQEGSEGYLIRITREIYENANLKKSVLLSEDYYAPVPKITVQAITGVVEPATDISQQGTDETTIDQTNKNADTTGTNAGLGNSDPQSKTELPSNQQKPGQVESTENLWGKPNEQPK